MPLLGAHVSVAGGLLNAFINTEKIGGEAIQIFSKNQRRWKAKPLDEEVAKEFKRTLAKKGNPPIASHGAYLLNLASPDPAIGAKTLDNLVDELQRCEALGVPYVVIHPGSHGGEGIEAGVKRIAEKLEEAFEESMTGDVMVLLETTSGAGHSVGSKFEHLRDVIAEAKTPERIGVCVDSCHIFAAGYELRTPEGYEATMENLLSTVGLGKVKFFHLNDSIGELSSKRDRHTHIGEGEIGLGGFTNIMNDPRLADHPMVLETPKGDDDEMDIVNLERLRSLIR